MRRRKPSNLGNDALIDDRHPTRVRPFALLAALIGLIALAIPAIALSASAISRQAEAVRILESEIAALDARFFQASAAYESARDRLDQVRSDIRKNTEALAKARKDFANAQNQLAVRVSAMYRQAQPTGLEVLLRSTSLSDAISRVDVMNRVQRQDVKVINGISAARERMRAARAKLAANHAEAKTQSREARSRLGEVRDIRVARRGVLLSARRQLAVMIAAEVARQANAQRLAALRAAQRRVVQRVGSGGDPTAPAVPSTPISTGGLSGDVQAALQKIAQCESGGNPSAISPSGLYRGKYQFDPQTWQSLGGSGDPAAASEAEQDRIAAILYGQRGAAPWPVCGR